MLHKATGFTLIETLVYIALLGLLISSTVTVIYQIIDSTGQTRQKLTILGEVDYLKHKLSWLMQGRTIINPPLGQTSNELILQSPTTAEQIAVSLRNHQLMLKDTTDLPTALTDNLAFLDNFSVTRSSDSLITIHWNIHGQEFTYETSQR